MKQEPCGYAFNIVSDYPELNLGLQLYRGENAVNHFLRTLVDYGDEIRKTLDINRPMIITPEQEIEFQNATECHICGGKIGGLPKMGSGPWGSNTTRQNELPKIWRVIYFDFGSIKKLFIRNTTLPTTNKPHVDDTNMAAVSSQFVERISWREL
jgi:hypothetical protein